MSRVQVVATEKNASACPECGGAIRATADDESVCTECGLVVDEDKIDRGPNWYSDRNGPGEAPKKHVGPPLDPGQHDYGLTTKIGYDWVDAYGNPLSSEKRRRLGRLRIHSKRARSGSRKERLIAAAFGEIDRMRSALGLTRERHEQACVIHRRAHEDGMTQGRCFEAVAAASLHAAVRCFGGPYRIEDIATVARVSEQRIVSAYAKINKEMDLPTPPPRPESLVPRLVSELDCPDDVRRRAEVLAAEYADRYAHVGAAPTGVAVSALYAAGRESRQVPMFTQQDLSATFEVSERTIQKRYQQMVVEEGGDE